MQEAALHPSTNVQMVMHVFQKKIGVMEKRTALKLMKLIRTGKKDGTVALSQIRVEREEATVTMIQTAKLT